MSLNLLHLNELQEKDFSVGQKYSFAVKLLIFSLAEFTPKQTLSVLLSELLYLEDFKEGVSNLF